MLLEYINEYNAETECPKRYHQWCYMGAIAAMLGRNTWLRFGHRNIYPNSYIMLIGQAAARKSTAINAAVDILRRANYDTIAQGRTSKEKFLLDLSGHIDDTGSKHSPEMQHGISNGAAIAHKNLFDADLEDLGANDEPHETLIAADEFTNFVGAGNYEFISVLGELWDNPAYYDNRVKNSKSFRIHKPCVNIIGGNTPTGFAAAFPPEMLGQGFVSRLLLVYGERTDTRITWPESPSEEIQTKLAEHFMQVRGEITGEITINKTGEAFIALDWLYKNWQPLDDTRFANYSGRRFSHLLKLCMLFTANALRTEITINDVIAANTLLTLTEADMPAALGEFGKSKNSDINNRVMDYLRSVDTPKNLSQIWKQIFTDGDSRHKLGEVLQGLYSAEKVITVKQGYLAVKRQMKDTGKYFDLSLIGGV